MKVLVRRLAVATVVVALIGIAAYAIMLEALVMSFAPNIMLQLELPVLFAILCLAGWRLITTLYKWAPNVMRKQADDS